MLLHVTSNVQKADSELHTPLQHALGKTNSRPSTTNVSVKKFFFDFSFNRLLPRGLIEGGNEQGERMVRRKLWAQYGRAMHFLNLEFEDADAEIEFTKDYTRRNKRWVEYAVLLRATVSFLYAVYRLVWNSDQFMFYVGYPFVAAVLYGCQYLQITTDREFVQRNFHHVIFFWAIVQSTWVNIFAWVIAPAEYPTGCDNTELVKSKVAVIQTLTVEAITTFTIVALIMYRMRFLYYLHINIWLIVGYYGSCARELVKYGYASPCAPVRLHIFHILIICCGLVFLSFTMEILQRKDFVQASMVYKESRRSDELLDNILPGVLVERLKNDFGGEAIAESYECVTVLFADVVSFTTMSAQVSAPVLVQLLDAMFLRFDDLASHHGVEKIKTIGDCYMAAAGLPLEDPNHAKTMARFGLAMLELVGSGQFRNPETQEPIRVRVGLHSGPCVAGVIGHKKFAYDIWGDTVNTAARMESHGEPMRLHCSAETYHLLEDGFLCENRGKMYVKGKGEMETYFICASKTESASDRSDANSMISIDIAGAGTARTACCGNDNVPRHWVPLHSFWLPSGNDAGSPHLCERILFFGRLCIRHITSLGQEKLWTMRHEEARSSLLSYPRARPLPTEKPEPGDVELRAARIQA